MTADRRTLAAGPLFLLALALAAAVYWPGLDSYLILDDAPQLRGLSGITKVPTWHQAFLYISSGTTGTLGRPLAMATFALQFFAWPSDAAAFKYVNLMLHLLNGCLVFLLSLRLLRRPGIFPAPAWGAVFVAAAWVLHPVHVNTVLYVVQRMTELSALFMLAGLLAYVHGRERAAQGATRRGYAWMSAGIAGGIGLGVLAKENAILLPLLALVLDATVLRTLARPARFRAWTAVFLLAPPLALLVHLLLGYQDYFVNAYRFRDFSPLERLLTEARVMFLYLRQLLLPAPSVYTFFYDDYVPSTGLFVPPVTAAAVAGIAGLLAAGFALRRRAPLAAAGILWFFTGHLLESTVLSLDLVYEHRNYLPLVGVLWTLAAAAPPVVRRATDARVRRWLPAVPVVFLAMLAAVTWQQTSLWARPTVQARVWSDAHPGSERAAQWAAGVALRDGDAARALSIYQRLGEARPDDASSWIGWLLLSCVDPAIAEPDRAALLARVRASTRRSSMNANALDILQDARLEGSCERVDAPFLHELLRAFLANPHHAYDAASFHFLDGEVLLGEGDVTGAVRELDQAFERTHAPEIALIQAGWLYDAHRLDEARTYVDRADRASQRNPVKHAIMAPSIDAWRRLIDAARARGTAGGPARAVVQ